MTKLMILAISITLFTGIYLILSPKFWRVIIGTVFLSHSIHMTLLASGGYFSDSEPPILESAQSLYMDPLPQALILTAIVISFGVTAFILIVLRQVYKETDTTDLLELEMREWRQSKDHE